MFTKLEQSLFETLKEAQAKIVEMSEAIEKQGQELEKAKEQEDFWYKAYLRESKDRDELEGNLEALKQEKEEQDASTSDSSDSLKEAV
jgi:ribosomal protein L11 methylase PrmA